MELGMGCSDLLGGEVAPCETGMSHMLVVEVDMKIV
jgi:hypothetical protein